MPLLQHLLRSPQTYLLLIGLVLGYGGLLRWQGTRPIVWIMGGAIALITLAAWVWQNRPQPQPEGAADNLLDSVIFRERLKGVERQLPDASQPEWTQAQTWALQIQQSAEGIAQREPSLTPDLLEALHTVLDLAGQVAGALQVTQKIQTEAYRQLAQEQLTKSSDRLRETWTQMQQLQDQLALSALEQQAAQTEPLPAQLRLLITNNKTTLHSDHPPAL